ncbi:hypothetical protein CP904_23900, partial [Enterobacter cloacae]
LHGDVLMWLMKTLLTSGCTNQRGAGQGDEINSTSSSFPHYSWASTEKSFMDSAVPSKALS